MLVSIKKFWWVVVLITVAGMAITFVNDKKVAPTYSISFVLKTRSGYNTEANKLFVAASQKINDDKSITSSNGFARCEVLNYRIEDYNFNELKVHFADSTGLAGPIEKINHLIISDTVFLKDYFSFIKAGNYLNKILQADTGNARYDKAILSLEENTLYHRLAIGKEINFLPGNVSTIKYNNTSNNSQYPRNALILVVIGIFCAFALAELFPPSQS